MSGRNQAAGCVVWAGMIGGGAAVGVLLVVVAEFFWPTKVEGGALLGVGVIGVVLGRMVLAGLVGAIIGGAAAWWAVGRFRRNDRSGFSPPSDSGPANDGEHF